MLTGAAERRSVRRGKVSISSCVFPAFFVSRGLTSRPIRLPSIIPAAGRVGPTSGTCENPVITLGLSPAPLA